MPVFQHNTVWSEHVPDSPIERYALDSANVQRVLYLLSDTILHRQQAAIDFLGYQQVVFAQSMLGDVRYIERRAPHAYPVASNIEPNVLPGPNPEYLYCTSIDRVRPFGIPNSLGEAPVAEYTRSHLNVTYSPLPYYIRTDQEVTAQDGPLLNYPDEGNALALGWATNSRYVARHIRPGHQTFNIKQGVLRWSGDINLHVPQGLPLIVPIAQVTYTWALVPIEGVPFGAIQSALGKVNDDLFDGFTAGTLLFDSIDMQPRRAPVGNRLMDVQYMFRWKVVTNNAGTLLGHNAFWRVRNNEIDWELTEDLQGNRPYRSFDMRKLFRPDQP